MQWGSMCGFLRCACVRKCEPRVPRVVRAAVAPIRTQLRGDSRELPDLLTSESSSFAVSPFLSTVCGQCIATTAAAS